MILESLLSGKRNLFWLTFHILLGFVCTFTPFALVFWFYIVLCTSINRAIINLKRGNPFLYICLMVYLVGFEMLGRMAKAYPFIPLELSKYFIIVVSILGIIITQKINKYWVFICVTSVLLLFIDYSGKRMYFDIVNNYYGFLAICLVLSFMLRLSFFNFSIHSFTFIIRILMQK